MDSLLALPPSSQEIPRKFKSASNNSSGTDGVEYKDIVHLGPSDWLMEVLYAAYTRREISRGGRITRHTN
jgi:hypothetical protein